jgi:acylphosphatase
MPDHLADDGADDGAAGAAAGEQVGLVVLVRGRVQGVGFRWWTRARALELGLVGWAANLDDGRVEVRVKGARSRCHELVALLTEQPPRPAPDDAPRSWYDRPGTVVGASVQWLPGDQLQGIPARGFVER